MKKIIGLLIIIIFFGCSEPSQQNRSNVQPTNTSVVCEKSVRFGNVDICLPIIDGMTECYSIPIVKATADKFEYKANSILAFYLNNDTYKQVEKLNEINYDDYFKISVTNSQEGLKFGQSKLNKYASMFEKGYVKKNWSDLKKELDVSLDDYMSVDKPILLESYAPDSNARTFVFLMKYIVGNYEYVIVMTMNIVLIKESIISIIYYKNYNGEQSIKKAKAKNDYIVLKLIDENK